MTMVVLGTNECGTRKGTNPVLSVRPKIAELAFHVYGRSLHPELFEIHKTRTVERGSYHAKIQITSAGHLVTWRYEGMTLTEVAASAQHPLPSKRRLLSQKMRHKRRERLECRGGITYEVDFSLEPVDPDMFWTFQRELCRGEHEGLVHSFEASGRFSTGAVSYVHVETRDRAMRIQAFHTFPDDCAMIKSQSRFLLPSSRKLKPA